MSKAIRRQHLKRLKAKRKHYWGALGAHSQVSYHGLVDGKVVVKHQPQSGLNRLTGKRLSQATHTPSVCSCLGCGNARRYVGKTLKELDFDLRYREQVEELLND